MWATCLGACVQSLLLRALAHSLERSLRLWQFLVGAHIGAGVATSPTTTHGPTTMTLKRTISTRKSNRVRITRLLLALIATHQVTFFKPRNLTCGRITRIMLSSKQQLSIRAASGTLSSVSFKMLVLSFGVYLGNGGVPQQSGNPFQPKASCLWGNGYIALLEVKNSSIRSMLALRIPQQFAVVAVSCQ